MKNSAIKVLADKKIAQEKGIKSNFNLPKGAKEVPKQDRRPKFIKEVDSNIQDKAKRIKESQEYANRKSVGQHLKNIGNELFVEPFKK